MEDSTYCRFYTNEESLLLGNNEKQLDQAAYEDAKYVKRYFAPHTLDANGAGNRDRYPLQEPSPPSMVSGSTLQSSASFIGEQNLNFDFAHWTNFNTEAHDFSHYKSPQHTDTLYPSTVLPLSQRFPQPSRMLLSKDGNLQQLEHRAHEISPFQEKDTCDGVPPQVTGRISRNVWKSESLSPDELPQRSKKVARVDHQVEQLKRNHRYPPNVSYMLNSKTSSRSHGTGDFNHPTLLWAGTPALTKEQKRFIRQWNENFAKQEPWSLLAREHIDALATLMQIPPQPILEYIQREFVAATSIRLMNNPQAPGLQNRANPPQSTASKSSVARLNPHLPANTLEIVEKYLLACHRRWPRTNGRRRITEGWFKCTYGCGYCTKRPFDWRRHEETHEPQELWLCYLCGQSKDQNPFLVNRRDKFLGHSKSSHKDWEPEDVLEMSKLVFHANFDPQCPVCPERLETWDERCKHIQQHYEDDLHPSSQVVTRRSKLLKRAETISGEESSNQDDCSDSTDSSDEEDSHQGSLCSDPNERDSIEGSGGGSGNTTGSHYQDEHGSNLDIHSDLTGSSDQNSLDTDSDRRFPTFQSSGHQEIGSPLAVLGPGSCGSTKRAPSDESDSELRVKADTEIQHPKHGLLYAEDQHYSGLKNDLPNDSWSAIREHALILATLSSATLIQPRSASSEIINEESEGSDSIRKPGLLHPKGDDVEDVASYSDHSADGNENGIADERAQVENVDEVGFMTETETDIEINEDGQTYENHVDQILATALVGVKRILLRKLSNCALFMTTGGSGSSSAQSSSPRSRDSPDASISLAPVQPQGRKRTRGDDRDPGDGGDESDNNDDDRPNKKHQKHPSDRPAHRRLKCPFYQREPEKYARAACRGEGFAEMAKLKDHIKRVHTQPLRCSRCWKEMKSDEEYMAHLQKETICDKLPEPPDDRIRPQMLKRLDFKKAPYAHAKNIEEKWKILYSVLFPTDTDLPSPYDQHGMSPHFERVLYEALEEELTKELAPALAPILRMIKDRLPTIIENCRLRLKRMPPDTKVVYAPSSSLSALHGSVGELISQNLGFESDAISRHSGSNLVGFTSFEECHSKAFGNPPLRSASPRSRSSLKDLQKSCHDSSPGSSMLSTDTASDLLYGINGNCADLSTRDFNALFAVPDVPNVTDQALNKSINLSKALGKQPQRKSSKKWKESAPFSDLQAATFSQYPNSDVSWDDVTTLEPQGKQSQNSVMEGDLLISTLDWNFNPDDLDLS